MASPEPRFGTTASRQMGSGEAISPPNAGFSREDPAPQRLMEGLGWVGG